MWPKWYSPPYTASWRDTLNAVAAAYKITPEDILGTDRNQRIVDARWVAAKALRAKGRLSYPRIGFYLNRDHSTIMHACQNFQHRAKYRPEMFTALKKALDA